MYKILIAIRNYCDIEIISRPILALGDGGITKYSEKDIDTFVGVSHNWNKFIVRLFPGKE